MMENTKEDKLIDYKWEGKIQERFMGTIFRPGNIYKVSKSLQFHNVMKAYFVLWFQEFPWVQAEEVNEMGKETVMIPLKSATSGVVKVGLTEGSGGWPNVRSQQRERLTVELYPLCLVYSISVFAF